MQNFLFIPSDWETRSICSENLTGAKGQGGMACKGTGEVAARHLGQGWKVNPCSDIEAGETYTLADIHGEGMIEHIWMTPSKSWRQLILRVYYEDAQNPAIEVPLGDFFCNGWDQTALINSQMICVNPGSAFNSYWQMPFKKRIRMTLTNLNSKKITLFYQITYGLGKLPPDIYYLNATWQRSNPLPYKSVHTILDNVQGRGQYVGTYIAWGSNSVGWWGEGEVKFFMDGDQEFPTICGTGTEDYFCGSYNFENSETKRYQYYSNTYTGLHQIIEPDGVYQSQQRFGMYRWHITDPIRFQKDLRVTIQALVSCQARKYIKIAKILDLCLLADKPPISRYRRPEMMTKTSRKIATLLLTS